MQQSKGRGFLKVCGILMIIGGALTIIVTGILGIVSAVAISALASDPSIEYAGPAAGLLIVAAIIGLIGGIVELIAGIVGVKNANRPEKATTCIVWGFIVLVLQIVSLILSFAGGGSNAGTIIVNIIAGIALPVLYLIGAFLNKKSA